MKVEFNDDYGRPLCFYHAVKAIIEKNKNVEATVPDISSSDSDGSGYCGQLCSECFPSIYKEE